MEWCCAGGVGGPRDYCSVVPSLEREVVDVGAEAGADTDALSEWWLRVEGGGWWIVEISSRQGRVDVEVCVACESASLRVCRWCGCCTTW